MMINASRFKLSVICLLLYICLDSLFFFFSSRRRHTRCSRDWSSDVCSSDLGAVGVNINIPVFNGFLYNARAKAADLQTEADRQRLRDLENTTSRDVRVSWQDTNRAYERLSVTQQLRQQADLALDLAQARYTLGLGSIVEFTQAELQKTEADIADTDATYQYRLTQLALAFTIAAPK